MAPKLPTDYEAPADCDPQEIDALLSKELMQLSFNDRNNISEEVHGVRTLAVEEKPFVQDEALAKLQHELNQIPPSEKVAFGKAQTLSITYVNDRKFRLRFLRAELFDAKLAAKRLTSYLELLLKLFGIEVLKRPLRTTDFKSKDEKIVLRGGLVQLLPYRDKRGRRVMVILSDIMSYNHIMRVKIFLYILTVAAEDDETQKNGVLFVMWPGKKTNIRMPRTDERVVCQNSFLAFPLRVVGFHFCWPDTPFFHFVRSFFVIVMGNNIRARVKFHSGERQELSYQLMGYGIPIQLLPTTESGAIKTKNHMQWLKTRQLLEKHADNAGNITTTPCELVDAIECPALNDVLYERSKPCQFHPGNGQFKGLIEAKKEEHALLTQTGKRDFAWSIVDEVEKLNGRFLTWDRRNGYWILIQDRSEIRLKVATSLRDFNKHSRALTKCQMISCVSKVNFEDGQDLKKRRVMVSDDESSQPDYIASFGDGSDGDCFPSSSIAILLKLFDVNGDATKTSSISPKGPYARMSDSPVKDLLSMTSVSA